MSKMKEHFSTIKKGAYAPFLLQLRQQLLVVDVHGDFEAKTNVTVFWSFPFHVNSPHIVIVKRTQIKLGHYKSCALFTTHHSCQDTL